METETQKVMKKFRVTWVEKVYRVVTVEAESFEQVESMIEEDIDASFLNKKPDDYEYEVFYDEVKEDNETLKEAHK